MGSVLRMRVLAPQTGLELAAFRLTIAVQICPAQRLPFRSERGTNGAPWKRNFFAFARRWNWALGSTIGRSAGWADGPNTDCTSW